MKKFGLILLPILVIVGCNDKKELNDTNNTDTFLTTLKSAPSNIVEKSNFPGWLVTIINKIETENSKDVSIVKVNLFQGEWNEQIVYFVRHNLSSCIFCEVYYEKGEKIEWPTDDVMDNFCATSKNWKLIYEYGNGTF